mgnify:CR=1 FL=1
MNPLSNLVYRRLFLAQITSLLGTGLATVALALLAWDLAGDRAGAVLGTALGIKMVAYVGVTPIVSALTRHLPRRALLVTLDCIRAACMACMLYVDAIWQVLLLIFVLNACSAGFTPAFQATIPEVLPDEATYTRALSLSRLAYDLEALASPSLAAIALALTSYHTLFASNAIAFVASGALVLSVALPRSSEARARTGLLTATVFGIRCYLHTPRLRGLLALSMAAATGSAMVIVNTVVVVRDQLGGDQVDTALALGAYGLGSMAVAVALPQSLERLGDRVFMISGAVLITAALCFCSIALSALGLGAVWLLLGAGTSLIQTPAGRLLARSSNANTRTAVYAAQFSLSHACWLITYPVAGWVGAAVSLEVASLTLASIAAGACLLALAVWPANDPTALEHTHPTTTHTHPHQHDQHHPHAHRPEKVAKNHEHEHTHAPITHTHPFVIDEHHSVWPATNRLS